MQKYLHKFADVFGNDLTKDDVGFRMGFDDEELCVTYEKVIYPTAGKRRDGSDAFILNTDSHHQGVRVSMCQDKGQPCKWASVFPNQFRTECKQQFVFRELLSLSPQGEPVKDHFEFPACCSCVLHKV